MKLCQIVILYLPWQSSQKMQDYQTKSANFHFILQKLVVCHKCPVNIKKENNILTTKMPTVVQILILSCKRFQSI